METLGKNPYEDISRDQRRRLTAGLVERVREAHGEERRELLDQIVLVNMCVARSIASRYRSRGISPEDLEQVANAALVRAVHNFDERRESDLLSYAVPSIRGELRRYFRDQGWTVRPPRRIQELQTRVIEERSRRPEGRDSLAEDEIAETLGVSKAEVIEALRADGCFTPTSLDLQVGEDGGTTLGQLLPDGKSAADREAADARLMLRPVVRRLPPRDRKLLKMRFYDDLTQQEIADEFGVTQTQVSRLLGRILADLRRGLGEIAPETERESPSA